MIIKLVSKTKLTTPDEELSTCSAVTLTGRDTDCDRKGGSSALIEVEMNPGDDMALDWTSLKLAGKGSGRGRIFPYSVA